LAVKIQQNHTQRKIKMSNNSIPEEIKKQADEIVRKFNETFINKPHLYYLTRYRGRFLYLDRFNYNVKGPICRLTYTGDINKWDFAIFKYSNGSYDPEEWFFPGSEHLNGTIEGAMKAGRQAYP
jgi:hypothetical protein